MFVPETEIKAEAEVNLVAVPRLGCVINVGHSDLLCDIRVKVDGN